jgi:hypothetical protein
MEENFFDPTQGSKSELIRYLDVYTPHSLRPWKWVPWIDPLELLHSPSSIHIHIPLKSCSLSAHTNLGSGDLR